MRVLLSILLLHVVPISAAESPLVIPESIRKKTPENVLKVLQNAELDYQEVHKGKEPIHDKFVEGPIKLDSGSRSYQGDRYKIIMRHRMCLIAGVQGMLYGPILTFDEGITIGEFSDIRFYSLHKFYKFRGYKIPGLEQEIGEESTTEEQGD